MTTVINGSSPSITFSDSTTQTTAFADGSVTQARLATGVAGTGPAFSAYKSVGAGNQSFSSITNTKVTFDTEEFDTNNNFATSTFTPTVAGYYQVNAGLDVGVSGINLTRANLLVYKNGSVYKQGGGFYSIPSGSEYALAGSCLVYCNGSSDYIEIYVYASGTSPTVYTGQSNTYFQASLVRTA